MPRTEEENRKIRETQRKKILKAAQESFLKKGQATTMADIAQKAGVSQGLAYRYFESKHAISMEIMRQMSMGDLFEISKVQIFDKTPTEKLEVLITELLKGIEQFEITIQAAFEHEAPERPWDFFHKTYHHMKVGTEEEQKLAKQFKQQFISLRRNIREIIIEGQKTGEFFQDNPDKLTIMVFTSIKGLSALAIRNPEQYQTFYPYTDIILRMLKVSK
jgi:AcrR family transcriptional regulator